jgi:hypothetical protein
MVGHNNINLCRVGDFADVFDELLLERAPDCVYEDNLFIDNQIRVVSGSPVRRQFITVKMPKSPVYHAHPVNTFG